MDTSLLELTPHGVVICRDPTRKELALFSESDAAGLIAHVSVEKLEGKVTDAVDMLRKLAASEHVEQVFVRHAFRFWMGRNETLSDSKTLIAADRAYVESGGSFNAVLVALLTSDSFLYRK